MTDDSKIKILWHSDSVLASTGFATVTYDVLSRLHETGKYDIKDICWNTSFEDKLEHVKFSDGREIKFTLLSGGRQQYAIDKIPQYIAEYKPDLFCTLLDSFMLQPHIRGLNFTPAKTAFYYPSDGEYFPTNCDQVLRKYDVPIAMSKFARDQVADIYGINSEYIPHGCFDGDTEVLTSYGYRKIKYLVENHPDYKPNMLISYEDTEQPLLGFSGVLTPSNILGVQEIKLKDSMLLIVTESGRSIQITKDNPVLGSEGYKPAGDLKLLDEVYIPIGINTNKSKDEHYEQCISCRDNRWRRKYLNNKLPKNELCSKEKISTSSSKNLYNKFRPKVKKIVRGEWLENFTPFFKWVYEKGNLLQSMDGGIESEKDFDRDSSISCDKKGAGKSIVRVCGLQNSKKTKRKIYGKRERASSPYKGLKYEKIVGIIEYHPKDKYVYDLTTTTSNFVANGILVHNCNNQHYYPFKEEDKDKAKMSFGIPPDKKVFGAVFRNQPRKMPAEKFKAFGQFAKDKDDVVMLVHSDPRDVAANVNLQKLVQRYGIARKVYWTGMSFFNAFPLERMKQVYNAMDVYISSTSGEGWGLCTVEAMACGVPVIITDFTTTKEIVFDHSAGLPVRLRGLDKWTWELSRKEVEMATLCGSWSVERGMCDNNHFVEQLQYAYDNPEEMKKMGMNGRKAAVEDYDYDKVVAPMFDKLFTRMVHGE